MEEKITIESQRKDSEIIELKEEIEEEKKKHEKDSDEKKEKYNQIMEEKKTLEDFYNGETNKKNEEITSLQEKLKHWNEIFNEQVLIE
jgi:hypothetical protein